MWGPTLVRDICGRTFEHRTPAAIVRVITDSIKQICSKGAWSSEGFF